MILQLQKIIVMALFSGLFTLAATPTFAASSQDGPPYAALPLSKAAAVDGAQVFEANWSAETMVIGASQGLAPPPNVTISFRWIGQANGKGSGEIDPWYVRPMDNVILSGVDSALWRGLPAGDHMNPGRWYAAHGERQTFIGTDITMDNGTLAAGLNMPPFIVGVGFGLRF